MGFYALRLQTVVFALQQTEHDHGKHSGLTFEYNFHLANLLTELHVHLVELSK